jgi:hypothetical protein
MRVLVLGVMLAGAAKGTTLYVHGQDVKLFSKPDPDSQVLKTLTEGQPVIALGVDSASMMPVVIGKLKGYVQRDQLSPSKPGPRPEPFDAEAFAASGFSKDKPPQPLECASAHAQECAVLKQLTASSLYQKTQAKAHAAKAGLVAK